MKVMGMVIAGLSAMTMSFQAVAELPQLEISGVVEVEASSVDDNISPAIDPTATDKSNDIVLATVEVALDAHLGERAGAHVSFLYGEDETDFGLDEGILSLGLNDGVALTTGRMYVPFGRFDSFMVSDPQTLEMAETMETVVMLTAENQGLYGAVYLFSGDADEAATVNAGDDDSISSGFNLGYAREGLFDIGLAYISNIADSDTLQELETSGAAVGIIDSSVVGVSAYFSASLGNVMLLGEHVTALDSFANGDLDGSVTNEEQPSASNIEIGVAISDRLTVAAGYQRTDEALFIGLPETVASAAIAYEVMEGATLAAEYASLEDYGSSDGGTGENADSFTMQLAVEF